MNQPESPRQINMFTGELEDTRTQKQKEQDRQRIFPQTVAMFSQRDIAQFGVTAHPLLSLADKTQLALIRADPRTPAEKERDLEREAQERTIPLFLPEPTQSGVYSPDAMVIIDPCRLLAAHSAVLHHDQAEQQVQYVKDRARLEDKGAERLLVLRLLYTV